MKLNLNIAWYFGLYTVALLIIINMAEYNNGDFFFSIRNLSDLKLGINKEKFNLFISFLTVGGLVVAIAQWMHNLSIRRKTDLNGLLEEIHHNFNIARYLFLIYDQDTYWRKIFNMLNDQTQMIYPNPDNPSFDRNHFNDCLQSSAVQTIPQGLIKLTNSFINSAITSDNIYSLSNQRIYANLGHLNYSIQRHNLNVSSFNKIAPNHQNKGRAFTNIQEEYYTWVNFRLSFMLVDLIMNTNEKYFIDRQYVKQIKAHIKRNSKISKTAPPNLGDTAPIKTADSSKSGSL